jgi:tRNA G18 (ribose-2'-O)-methylase SpoU
MSYFSIGICNYKHECNIGTLFRSAYAFNANFVFTIGRKYKVQASDTCNTIKQIPYFHYLDSQDFIKHLPKGCEPICIEIKEGAPTLEQFVLKIIRFVKSNIFYQLMVLILLMSMKL